ncbi:junction-mediating and -regulatory [Pelobates cultripes]|uniref:Junction-mediating and -regulatory n=1 Tax=Pelobates cultripes TaxID=61616 RepID=A0AAD1SDC1_PELCU|nr:junction-mediating and -regulatory [Pelobates cultripes]
MADSLEDSLEADWVAVRPNVFEEKERRKFVFIVAWNEVEGKFAITCHNRTAQRQRSAEQGAPRSPARGHSQETTQSPSKEPRQSRSPSKDGGPLQAPRDKAGPLQAPRDKAGPLQAPRDKAGPHQAPRDKAGPHQAPRDKAGPHQAPRDKAGPHQAPRDQAGGGSPSREESAEEECSWAGLFSFQDLRAVHQQLSSVSAELGPHLPTFPEEPSGMWSVLFGAPEMSEEEVEMLCGQLQLYLGHALDTCGWKILSQVLFTESDDPDEYYESLSELRHKGYEEVLHRARRRLQELLEKHKTSENVVELLELYEMEDEAYSNVVEATTELYQYLLQPFRDMRELAMLRRQQIKISIENDYLGPRRIESLRKEDADWQRKAHMAVLSIQDLTVKYFEITAKAQKAVFDRMRTDQKKFGKGIWASAVERMEKLQYGVSKETLQLMRAKEICLEQKKHALKEEMQSLQGGTEAIQVLDHLESDYYGHQLQLYEVQFEILKCEELLLTAQLESIRRQISEKTDEVVYYDTYESMEAMLETEDMASSIHLQREELRKRQLKVRQLEAKRGRISAKKAYLRNKKEICIAKHDEKVQQRFPGDGAYVQHAVQLSKDQQQDEDERKSIWVSEERQKTLDRLRTFKQRHPGQVILKSTRLRLTHSKRKTSARITPCLDEPQSFSVSIQTQVVSDVEGPEVLQPTETKKLEGLIQLEDNSLPPDLITSELPQMTSLPSFSHEKLEIDTVQPHSLPVISPPPAPPLPPPPPLKEETAPLDIRVIHVKKETDESAALKSATVPLSQLFDSNQLLSARKKLKKTGALEDMQKRRVSSPMDEVLASLKRGTFHLKKVEQRTLAPSPDEDDSNNILAQIRKGVKLKKVEKDALRESFTLLPDADPLTRSIHEALRRIKEASPESEDEEDSLPCTDWEN